MTAKVFRCFRDLKLTLGRLDAAHELAELALCHLDDSIPSGKAYQDHIANLSLRFSLHVRQSSSVEAHRVVALSAIACVHACYEEFLTGLAIELLQFGEVDLHLGTKAKDVSKHDHIVGELKKTNKFRSSISNEKFGVFNQVMTLLSLIRNSQAHRGREIPKRIAELTTQLQTSPYWMELFSHRPPPNKFFDLCFADFLLFAEAARATSEYLSRLLLPSPHSVAAHPDFIAYCTDGAVSEGERMRYLADRFALDEIASRDVLSCV